MSTLVDSLTTRLRALEGRVEEARQDQSLSVPDSGGGGDTFSPDFGQVIAPDGTVTYDLQAHLHATGIDLDAGDTAAPPDDRKIRWLRTSDGAAVAQLGAYMATPPNNAGAFWRMTKPGSSQFAELSLYTQLAFVEIDATVDGGSGAKTVAVIRNDGASSFLQLAAIANRKANFGTALMPFAGGGNANVAVPHGLGVAPSFIYMSWNFNNVAVGLWGPYYHTVGAATFTAQGVATVAVAGNVAFSWLAIA